MNVESIIRMAPPREPIEQDPPQAVVLATLDALNRVVGGLRVKEPTEYVLRPTTS